MIGDFLFALTPRDEQITPLAGVAQRRVQNEISPVLIARFAPPFGRLFRLSSVVLQAESELAGSSRVIGLQVAVISRNPLGTVRAFIFREVYTNGPGGLPLFDNGEWVQRQIYPGQPIFIDGRSEVLECAAIFDDASVAGNGFAADVTGVLMPAGNWSLDQLEPL